MMANGRGSEAGALIGEAETIFTTLRAAPWAARARRAQAVSLR